MSKTITFTGIVVCYNDAKYLRECLSRLKFCSEIIAVDLGSSDDSVKIAREMGAHVVPHEWVNIVEKVRAFAVSQARNDWLVFLDPDLIFPENVDKEIEEMIERDPQAGIVGVYYQNYFISKPLNHGRWGGKNVYPAVMHRDRVILDSKVHRGIKIKPGYRQLELKKGPGKTIIHYWSDSWGSLVSKANRYIAMEGESKYKNGERTSLVMMIARSTFVTLNSLFIRTGFLDGVNGILLSLFAGWYEWNSELSLLRYQREVKKSGV